jgi:branched-chain amino acid aminotransferase
MSHFLLFNGAYYAEGTPLLAVDNRAFCYGDGFFESMRVSNGTLHFIKGHWQRLEMACRTLRIQIPGSLTQKEFHRLALELCQRNGFQHARIRFQGYRMGAGRYAPEHNVLGWSMVCSELDSAEYLLNAKGLKMAFCTSHRINPAPQSTFKSSNALPYILGGIYAAEQQLDDCFLLDAEGFVAEATGSNVFLLKGNELVTPDLSNGGVAGVMRSVVLSEAASIGLRTSEALITEEDVLEADECFLTNAARGIQWVAAVGKKRYYRRGAEKLTRHINTRFGLIN